MKSAGFTAFFLGGGGRPVTAQIRDQGSMHLHRKIYLVLRNSPTPFFGFSLMHGKYVWNENDE